MSAGKFDYPKSGDRVKCTKDGSFAVWGSVSDRIEGVRCLLVDKTGELNSVGKLLFWMGDSPAHVWRWSMAFESVEEGLDPYVIELRSSVDNSLLARVNRIKLVQQMGPSNITSPSSGAQISSTFTAYGTTDAAIQSTSNMNNGGGNVYGSITQRSTNWWITFSGLAAGSNGWVLTVKDSDGPTDATKNNLSVAP